MEESLITLHGSSLHYTVSGQGNRVAILFHGFGQDQSVFSNFPEETQREFTVYSFDIFFHGKSIWTQAETPITLNRWREMFELFLKKEKINRFVVGGYSIGSRLAVACIENFSERIDAILLLAPDAVVSDFWYRAATATPIARFVFRSMIDNYPLFLRIANSLQRLHLISPSMVKFAKAHMDSESKRSLVYHTWIVLRKLRIKPERLITMLNSRKIPVVIYAGKFDRVITFTALSSFFKRLHRANMVILDTGHLGIVRASIPFLLTADVPSR